MIEQIFILHHTHVDLGYTDSRENVTGDLIGMIDSVIELVDRSVSRPEPERFHWIHEVSWPVLEYIQRGGKHQEKLFEQICRGYTGPFLILILNDETKMKQAVELMRKAGLHNVFRIADYGLHVYYNIPSLVNKIPLSPAGNPWNLKENAQSVYGYDKGACPTSDALFSRSILVPIPSRLTAQQEEYAVQVIQASAKG